MFGFKKNTTSQNDDILNSIKEKIKNQSGNKPAPKQEVQYDDEDDDEIVTQNAQPQPQPNIQKSAYNFAEIDEDDDDFDEDDLTEDEDDEEEMELSPEELAELEALDDDEDYEIDEVLEVPANIKTVPTPASNFNTTQENRPQARAQHEAPTNATLNIADSVVNSVQNSIQKALNAKQVVANQIEENLMSVSMYDVVTSILKPHLQSWINQNLPDVVNRIVEKEIRRLMDKE